MNKLQKIRIPLDITMTILSIILMGGNYLFPLDIVHEILGAALFVLWAVHITLNRRWYGAVFKGKYNPYRVMQTLINFCILICTIFLMISGIILSNQLFTFLNIQGGLGFARIVHLLASHWYYLFMSMHIGLHAGMIANKIKQKRESSPPEQNKNHSENLNCHSELVSESPAREMPNQVRHDKESEPHDKLQKILPRIVLALVCLYGIYAFIVRGVWRYLILQQQFFFFDLERGYFLFAIDYISIIVLFATISHFAAKALKKNR